MSTLTIKNLTKTYGKLKALDQVDLEVADGELLAILGPSGSGKSTLVRAIAGFAHPDAGSIVLGDRDITYEKPEHRNTAMVFQSYALWPHMSVVENIAFGLKLLKKSRQEISKKVQWALELVDLQGLDNRLPRQLSGGQQQRVALARAMVVDPKLLLLDEPLSNLDAKIRYRLRFEIKKLQKKLGITTIYITHDQEEALSIADSVVILKDGRVLQHDKAEDIYAKPKDAFVAEFLGASNIFNLPVDNDSNGAYIIIGGVKIPIPDKEPGESVAVIIRADEAEIGNSFTDGPDCFVLNGSVNDRMYLGSRRRYEIRTAEGYTLLVDSDREYPVDTVVQLRLNRTKVYIF